jgi:intermediate cleaving peptidase 55
LQRGLSSLVTPGISAIEYYNRRQKLAELLPSNSIAILAAGDLKYRSGSSAVFYNFHQDADFSYLTGSLHDSLLHRERQMLIATQGFLEPEALAVIGKLYTVFYA